MRTHKVRTYDGSGLHAAALEHVLGSEDAEGRIRDAMTRRRDAAGE